MSWSARSETISTSPAVRYMIDLDSRPASWSDVIHSWQDDSCFRAFFNALLAASSFTAFRWETPAVTSATAANPFECVVMDCPGLARRADPEAFAEHFSDENAEVAVFSNLGGDAIMVVPKPLVEVSAYGHLATFVRRAPESQQQALWHAVGQTMSRRLGAKPVWLNTAGAGVSWLHVRLDDRPKYYSYAPYRQYV